MWVVEKCPHTNGTSLAQKLRKAKNIFFLMQIPWTYTKRTCFSIWGISPVYQNLFKRKIIEKKEVKKYEKW